MNTDIKNLTPQQAIHPGEILESELDARNIKQGEFAQKLGIAKTQLNEIIKGKRNITPDFALLLQAALQIDAEYWMNLQSLYDLDIAKIKTKTKDKTALIERWNIIEEYVPIKYFRKEGFLIGDTMQDELMIKNIYNAASIDDIIYATSKPIYNRFKKSSALVSEIKNVVAWAKLVEYKAKQEDNSPTIKFSFDCENDLINELRKSFHEKDIVQKTKSILNTAGIQFIIQEKPDQAPIDGIIFWKIENPSIGVTLRHKRIDNFAFTVFHELGHLFTHLRKDKDKEFVDDIEDDNFINENAEEFEANSYAKDKLIPSERYDEFLFRHNKPNDEEIISFAKEIDIHPSIVKGRLSHDGYISYKRKTVIENNLN